MRQAAFIEVNPLFGKFDGRTGRLLSLLPKEVCGVEYDAGILRFFFEAAPLRVPGFLKEMYPHATFSFGFYEKE